MVRSDFFVVWAETDPVMATFTQRGGALALIDLETGEGGLLTLPPSAFRLYGTGTWAFTSPA